MTKPINVLEQLRQAGMLEQQQYALYYMFNGWKYYIRARELEDSTGRRVPLTRKEAALLTLLVTHDYEIIPRQRIAGCCELAPLRHSLRAADVLVSRLRRKLQRRSPDSRRDEEFIRSVRLKGYFFASVVRKVDNEARAVPRTTGGNLSG